MEFSVLMYNDVSNIIVGALCILITEFLDYTMQGMIDNIAKQPKKC